jgi:hypothetical protein
MLVGLLQPPLLLLVVMVVLVEVQQCLQQGQKQEGSRATGLIKA